VRDIPTDADLDARRALRSWNCDLVETTLEHLAAWGVVPVRIPGDGRSYARTGEVKATMLAGPRAWTTANGSELHAEPGDWLVESTESGIRTVAAGEFPLLYERVGGSRYRRRGTVSARRAPVAEDVESIEGTSRAEAGDWVITDVRGNRWPISDGAFRASYRRASGTAERNP
jgi:hypothetical protein